MSGAAAHKTGEQRRRWPLIVVVTLIALAGLIGFTSLAIWQVNRLHWKVALIERVEARVHAAPVPAPGPDDWAGTTAESAEYRHVTLRGTFLNDRVGVACMDFAGGHVTRQFSIAGDSVEAVLNRIDEAFDALLEQTRFRREDVLGVGFAIAGYLMKNGRYNPPDPLKHWSEVDLARRVSERFGLPCWTDNSANTAALCEAMFGLGRRHRDLVYLSFNYGFGAGIISEGDLLRGAFGNAGEIGMIFTPEEAEIRPALGLLLAHLRRSGHDVRSIEELDRAVSPMLPEVTDWVGQVAPQLNRVLNAVTAVADPACIVFGGQIPRPLAQAFIDRAEFFARPRHGHINPLPELAISTLGGETPAVGAACLPLRALLF